MSTIFCRATFVVTLFVISWVIPATASGQDAAPPKDPTAAITAKIVEARDYTAEFVSLAKQSLAQKPADLDQSRKLYAAAYSKYNAWVVYVKTSLRQGNAKNLNKDSAYQKVAADASESATQFTAFVDSKTGQSKAITAILASLADLGLKLYNGMKDRKDKDRTAAADAFEKDAQWQPWDKVGAAESPTPKKDDSSAPKKDDSSTPKKDDSTSKKKK